jgi:hypothetical protein
MRHLNVLFQNLTLAMLGAVGDYSKVRIGWPTSGQPAWKIDEDIVFLRIAEVDHPINRLRDLIIEDRDDDYINQAWGYTRVIGVTWVVYGPASYDNANMVRDKIFFQTFHDLLAADYLYLVPDVPAPRRVPELFQGQWWERSDLHMQFNTKAIRNETIRWIRSTEIIVIDKTGEVARIDITAPTT